MKTIDEKIFVQIIRDIWSSQLSMELAVAITFVLNTYDFYINGECMFDNKSTLTKKTLVEGPFSFSYEAISHILSDFDIDGEKYRPAVWRNKWIIESERFYKEKAFIHLMNDVEEKIKKHRWIQKAV